MTIATRSRLENAAWHAVAQRLDETRQDESPAQTIRRLQDELDQANLTIARLQSMLADRDAEIKQLNSENDSQRAELFTMRRVTPSPLHGEGARGVGIMIGNRRVLNQTQAARVLSKNGQQVRQYQISRWLKKGEFETTIVDGRVMIFEDSLRLPPTRRSRKAAP